MLRRDTGDAAERWAAPAPLAQERGERFTVIGTTYSQCWSQRSGVPTRQKDCVTAVSPARVLDEVQIQIPFICLPFMGQAYHRRAQQAFMDEYEHRDAPLSGESCREEELEQCG